jgi:hypothetical protein
MTRARLAVRLTRHVIRRWRMRVCEDLNPNALQDRVRRRLAAQLRLGVQMNGAGALEIEILPGVRAVCIPSVQGGWTVVTIV